MTDDRSPPPPRLYDDEEVARILERATELHREEPVAVSRGGSGISLEELEEIAREAGIDPRHLRRAAMEVGSGSAGPEERDWAWFLGDVPTIRFETTVRGEVRADDLERIVGAIRMEAGEAGQPNVLGRTLTWRAEATSDTRQTQLTVSARDGVTVVSVEERLHNLAGAIFGGGVGGFGGGFGFGMGLPIGLEVIGSAIAAVALPAAILGLSYAGARAFYTRTVHTRRRVLSAIMEATVAEVRRSVERRAVEGGSDAADRLPSG